MKQSLFLSLTLFHYLYLCLYLFSLLLVQLPLCGPIRLRN